MQIDMKQPILDKNDKLAKSNREPVSYTHLTLPTNSRV